jgi:hypothetical protein
VRQIPKVTDLLEKAFSEAAKLPPEEQDALANWLLEEMESERRWRNIVQSL